MISIVSGCMRSGTSMMMGSLIAGGMDAYFSKERDQLNHWYGDNTYQPNEGGFFEPDKRDFENPLFPLGHDDKLVKILFHGAIKMPINDYRIVFMLRDPEEIGSSILRFFKKQSFTVQQSEFLLNYWTWMKLYVGLLRNRKDVRSVTVLRYEQVLANPVNELARIPWEFDLKKAAAVINPSKRRVYAA